MSSPETKESSFHGKVKSREPEGKKELFSTLRIRLEQQGPALLII